MCHYYSGVTELQSTEPGSNFLSCRQISRHPSLHSCSSVESNASSTCDSAEIDSVQASEENWDEGQPLVNGGIKPGGCSNNRANRQNQQQSCKQCTRKSQPQSKKGKHTLSIERDRSNKQVNDLKEQLYNVKQKATGYVIFVIFNKGIYQYTIQRLERDPATL